MAITREFMEAVQSGNILLVRIMLKDILLLDPTGNQFDEMQKYAMSSMDNLYSEHDDEILNFDMTAWNEEYLNEQMVAVVNDFSKERVELLKNMVQYLYKNKADQIRKERECVAQSHTIPRKQVGIGVAIAGSVLAVAGLCTAHIAMAIGGAVVAAAGVALIVSEGNK